MKLLVTGPLNLPSTQVVAAIKSSKFTPKTLIMTEEFSQAQLMLSLSEEKSWDKIISVPASENDFGPCAKEVRLFEMVNQADAILIVVPPVKMPPDGIPFIGEPGLKLSALLNLAKKAQLEIKTIDIDS